MRISGSPTEAYHLANYGNAPYEAFLDSWLAEDYDPEDRFGVYYSGGLDWSEANTPPIGSTADVAHLRPTDAGYAAYATAHVRDLIERF